MYFDIAPKSRKEDFFNYSSEYEELENALKRKEKIVALVGPRRVGKTSLMNVFYNQVKAPKAWIDGRIIENPKKDIPSVIWAVAETGQQKVLGKIEGIGVSAFGVGLDFRLGAAPAPGDFEKKVGKAGQIIVFIDEAQKMDTKALANTLSYFYDRFPNVSFVISGSEIGLVDDILGTDDRDHPLHGRNIIRIKMERLARDRASEFFEKGFGQLGTGIKKDELAAALDELDGLIGWLALYGYKKGVVKSSDALKETLNIAAQVAASELSNFMKKRKAAKMYLLILRHATGISWSELKARVERELGKGINPRTFSFAAEELIRYSFLEKRGDEYHLSDPLLFKASFLL